MNFIIRILQQIKEDCIDYVLMKKHHVEAIANNPGQTYSLEEVKTKLGEKG